MSPPIAQALIAVLDVLFWIVIARAVLSWFVRDPDNPVVRFLATLTDPFMRPLSSVLTFGGLDLSPLVVLLGIQFVQRLLQPYAVG